MKPVYWFGEEKNDILTTIGTKTHKFGYFIPSMNPDLFKCINISAPLGLSF